MSTIVQQLIQPKEAENTQTTQYTVTANTRTIIDKFTATNTSSSTVTLSVNLVIDGGSTGNSNLIVKSKNILPSETYTFPELTGHVLLGGGFISTIAGTASSITIAASGREIA